MRDFALTLIIFGAIPCIILRPHIGIVMWTWVSLMNPHRLTWGYSSELPISLIIGLVTIAAWMMSKESKKVPWTGISVVMLLFVLWTNFTVIFAIDQEAALAKGIQFDKIVLMVFLTMVLMGSEKRLNALIWTIALSIGFYSVKGGIFTLLGGAQNLVWGPAGSFIEDNKALALATLMAAPLMYYLSRTTENRWLRWGLAAGAAVSMVSVVGSYSRGAFVAMTAVAIMFWWRSQHRMIVGALFAIMIVVAIPLIPSKWVDRMQTIETYEQDYSATSRLEMWLVGVKLAMDRPLVGGGHGAFVTPEIYRWYKPKVDSVHNVHSVYFEAMGHYGFVGFGLFMVLGFLGLRSAKWIRTHTRGREDLKNEFVLGSMLQVSIVGYAVAGAFLNLATFDLYYTLLAVILLARQQVERKLAEEPAADTVRSATARRFSRLAPAHRVAVPDMRGNQLP